MKHERVALVVNHRARLHQRDPRLLDRVRGAAGAHLDVHVTENIGELREVAEELAARGVSRVLFSGGDGTLMEGVSALAAAYGEHNLPAITPIPGGTACTVARNWGIHGHRPEVWVRRSVAREPWLRSEPTLRVSWPTDDDQDTKLGFIFGTGLVARFFQLYYERGAPGYLGSAKMVAQIFAGSFVGGELAGRVLDPMPCALEVDGQRLSPPRWSLICSAVVKNLGLHMMVTHRGGDAPHHPHLVATPLPPGKLGPRAPWVLAGRPIGGPDDVDELVQRFVVSFAELGPFVLDGELLMAQRVEVSAGPQIRIALPR